MEPHIWPNRGKHYLTDISLMEKDLISIIIPVYNTELYLDRCIKSIINQNYDNIEIILVNDGSTDSSPRICSRWMDEKPDVIRVIHQENSGASIARKTGIENSRGEYLTFIDSDDYALPGYISSMYQAIRNHNTLISVSLFKKIFPEDKHTQPKHAFDTNPNADSITLSQHDIFKRFFKYEFWGYGGGMYHKSLFNNIIYPEHTVYEDYFVKAQIFAKINSVAYCPQALYIYELHPGGLSTQKLSLRALGEFDNAYATWQYISAHKPEFKEHALAILSEVLSKFLGKLRRCGDNSFSEYERRIRAFVKNNLTGIIMNPHFLWKIKIKLLQNLLRF